MSEDGPRTVLALRALGLGDLLTALPALRALRRPTANLPHSFFVLAAPAWLAPLALLSGAVDHVVATEPLGPIACHRPSLALDLHGRGPQSHRRLLETEPERLIAFRHPEVSASAGGPVWREHEHEVDRWCRLLEESGIPADRSRLELDPTCFPMPRLAHDATLIHPGAASAARRWPAERWAVVARRETALGRPVAITAGPGEEALAGRIAALSGLGQRDVYAGRDLAGLAGLVAAAARVLSGDTGVAHLATALGRPSVVLFGPTSPERWGPPAGGPHRVLWAGRRGDPHGDRPDPGLLEILPVDVIRAVEWLPTVRRSTS